MTDTNDPSVDQLLHEVEVRTDGTGHWTGQFELTIGDTDLVRRLAAEVKRLRDENDAWAVRWQQQFDRAEKAEAEAQQAKDELAEKWELYQACTGYDVYEALTPRIDKLYMALNARARGDENDLDGDPAEPWNRLVGLAATAVAHWIVASRWAVNEHQRVERADAEVERLRRNLGTLPIQETVKGLAAEVHRLRAELDAAQLRSIEARNPGIDMDEVRRIRAGGHPDPDTPTAAGPAAGETP